MSEQNSYRIERNYKKATGEWRGWGKSVVATVDTWQEATQWWLGQFWAAEEYTVVSENPSEDSRSGIIEIQFDPPRDLGWLGVRLGVKIKATLVED